MLPKMFVVVVELVRIAVRRRVVVVVVVGGAPRPFRRCWSDFFFFSFLKVWQLGAVLQHSLLHWH